LVAGLQEFQARLHRPIFVDAWRKSLDAMNVEVELDVGFGGEVGI
jgi:hypothetical protein